jgi:hypothetical protein
MENTQRRQIGKTVVGRKKLLLGTAAFVALTASAGVIHAGYKWNSEVAFTGTATAGTFTGTVGAARASTDSLQYIGREVQWSGPTPTNLATVSPTNVGYCYARDRAGNSRGCYVTIKYGTAAALLANVNANSYIGVRYFSTVDAAYCDFIDIANYSYNPVAVN